VLCAVCLVQCTSKTNRLNQGRGTTATSRESCRILFMPRTRRVYQKRSLYEVVSRARQGLPLPPTETTNEILAGIYGRAQRDQKVTLCNFVEMNNHNHVLAIPKTPKTFPEFYGELKKGVTDSVKSLLGLSHLTLWEDRSSVAVVPKLEDAIGRLVYIFCNPTKAGLVDSIDEFPGLSSWHAFKTCEPSVRATVSISVRSYHKAAIPRLPDGDTLTEEEDKRLLAQLRSSDEVFEHDLVIKPLAWLELFGITDPKKVQAVRARVIRLVYQQEAKYRKERTRPVMGAQRLRSQQYFKQHTPAKRDRKVFVISSDPEIRKRIIAFVRHISQKCRVCYERMKQGLPVRWPKGIFIPWLPPKEFCSLSP
jgi:hypothetical protein